MSEAASQCIALRELNLNASVLITPRPPFPPRNKYCLPVLFWSTYIADKDRVAAGRHGTSPPFGGVQRHGRQKYPLLRPLITMATENSSFAAVVERIAWMWLRVVLWGGAAAKDECQLLIRDKFYDLLVVSLIRIKAVCDYSK